MTTATRYPYHVFCEDVFVAYVECAFWASTTDDGTPLDADYNAFDLDPADFTSMRAEVVDFLELIEREGINLTQLDPTQTGHDFWLTRNHHGAGFWDRGLGDLGDDLTRWAHTFGETDLYIGDDGRVHNA